MSNIVHAESLPIQRLIPEISEVLSSRRSAKTNPEDVKERAGAGGKKYKYVASGAVFRWLDKHYPGWSWETDSHHIELANFVSVRGTLTVFNQNTGELRKISSWGADEAIIKSDSGKLVAFPYLKAAETDALKRCVVKLGGFNDVYGYEEDPDNGPVITEEDINWYFSVALGKYPPYKMFKQIKALIDGLITVKDLKENL